MGLLTERLLIALSDRGSETCKHQCSIGNVLRDDVTHEIVASELSRSPSARASSGSGESSGNSRAGVARNSGFGASVLRPVRAMSCLTERASLSGTICIVTIASMPEASASAILVDRERQNRYSLAAADFANLPQGRRSDASAESCSEDQQVELAGLQRLLGSGFAGNANRHDT